MEFTREILQKLKENAQQAKGLSREQAMAELHRAGIRVERLIELGRQGSGSGRVDQGRVTIKPKP